MAIFEDPAGERIRGSISIGYYGHKIANCGEIIKIIADIVGNKVGDAR